MDTEEKIRIAKIAISKRWDYETLKYSDDMYGNEKYAGDVYDYVQECDNIGRIRFLQKYGY